MGRDKTTRKGKKRLEIGVQQSESADHLQITIEDNGIGRQASQLRNYQNPLKSQSLGLSIIQDRLDFFSKRYKGNFNFIVYDLKDDKSAMAMGTKVVLNLPKLVVENAGT